MLTYHGASTACLIHIFSDAVSASSFWIRISLCLPISSLVLAALSFCSVFSTVLGKCKVIIWGNFQEFRFCYPRILFWLTFSAFSLLFWMLMVIFHFTQQFEILFTANGSFLWNNACCVNIVNIKTGLVLACLLVAPPLQ